MDEKKYNLAKAISFIVSAFALLLFVCAYIHDKRYEVSNFEAVVVITDKWKKDAKMILPSRDSVYYERMYDAYMRTDEKDKEYRKNRWRNNY